MWRCPDPTCSANNAEGAVVCEVCETPRRGGRGQPPARLCPVDETPLHANGICPRGNGWPAAMRCPIVCETCRGPLTWDGKCFRCWQSDPRPTMTQGDRYELTGGHWVKVGGRERIPAPHEGQAAARVLQQLVEMLADNMTLKKPLEPEEIAARVDEAHEQLGKNLPDYPHTREDKR